MRRAAKVAPSDPTWMMPVVWCGATAAIIASGLAVPLAGGAGDAGFGYIFELSGSGAAFKQGLALYGLAAAAMGAAFMFVPKMRWPISKGLAWSTFMLMVLGGTLMLVVPQLLIALADGDSDRATGLARMWSSVWVEVGGKLWLAGVVVGAATFFDAWLRARARA